MERSWWGWGWREQALSDDECMQLAKLLPGQPDTPLPQPEIGELPAPRIDPPASLACSSAPRDRAAHTYGKAYRDVVRALHNDLTPAPDLVAFPKNETDIVDILDWAGGHDVAVVPYGGGSSVVGGVEYRGDKPVISLDLSTMDNVVEIDRTSRIALIQAGMFGPALEDALRPEGLTLRHFPQSFEFSTLGGWLATRAGGHFATGPTHIDDLTASIRAVTPTGAYESWPLPGSGAGPSPDRLFLGSEGILGIITQAWMRLQDRPVHRASAAVTFADFADAVEATRAIAQSGLQPANCRLLDPGEATLSGAANGASVLVLGFESAHVPVDASLAAATEMAKEHHGTVEIRQNAVTSWRSAFLRMPYVRDGLARMSAIVETFETACRWRDVPALVDAVRTDVGAAVRKVCGADGMINCRFTHVYPDGAAPYFTVIAPGKRGSELAIWDEIKAAAGDVLSRSGATITHHHAVGRDHRPWYDRQRPEPFAAALTAAKHTLDPRGILNPGVLIGE